MGLGRGLLGREHSVTDSAEALENMAHSVGGAGTHELTAPPSNKLSGVNYNDPFF